MFRISEDERSKLIELLEAAGGAHAAMRDFVRQHVQALDPLAEDYRALDAAIDAAEREADEYRRELRVKYLPGNIKFRGGPHDGQPDTFPDVLPLSIGANERVEGELRTARGAYVRSDDTDDQGRVIFDWHPLQDD